MSRLPGISDLFRSRSQARRRNPKRRREAERFAGRMESLESRAMLAFSTLPASGNLGGGPLAIFSDAAGPNELTIILDDTTNPGSITATITTNDAVPQTRQFFNFSDISYLASNDTDGSVVNSVKLWTSYEADLAGFENAPADDSEVGLATLWQVKSHFPAGAATTSLLKMENVDTLVVTSGVIGGGASTIAGEFESPTLAASLTAGTAAQVTLNSGTRVTGANIGGTTALEPIVAYTLTLQSQAAGVTLDTDVFTVGDLTINAAGTITLNGLLQSTSGDIEAESTSGQILLDGAELHALDGGITLRTLKEGIVQVPATAPNPRWQDYIVAETDVTIEAGGEVRLIGGVRANTGDIELSSKDRGIQFTGDDAVLHAVAGSVEINATRGAATLQNLFANKSITVNALGDVSLSGTIQTTTGDFAVKSDGNIGNSARLLVGGSLTLDSGLNVSSLGGGIVRLELLSGGSDYDYAIVTIAPPAAGGGRAALARATVSGGQVTALTIVDPGFGYAPNEQVAVSIEGNPATGGDPAASGARATAFAGSTLSSMQAGKDLAITAGTAVDISNELRAESGKVTVAVSAGPLSLSDIFAGEDVSLTAAQTIDLGGLVRTAAGDVSVKSTGGGVDVGATLIAPAGGAEVTAAGQIVQRGGSVSRERLFLLSGGRDYTYALVVVDPPPGAGQAALARAVITYYNPLDPSEGGFISDIVLLDPGWGYPSDSRVNVSIQGDGEGATAVFATDIVTSSIDVRDDVIVRAGDAITLVSSVRSSAGNVTLRNSMGDLAVQSVTSALAAEVESERGKVTLVSVAAGGNVDIAAFRGVSVTDSVNTTAGDIAITTIDGDLQFVQGFDFGDNYLVNADATALQPLAVIATAAGGIELRSDNGSITTPFVINATDDVKITSFGLLEATDEITSTKGDVELRSTSGLVQLGANLAAVGGSITIAAHTQLRQQVSSGVSKIQLLSPGEVVEDTAPQVTVTVAAPRNGGTAATAVAIIERRSTGDGFGADDDEYFLGGIAIIDAGQGYAVGEQPSVTITGINGASARAFGPLNAAMLSAGEGITLTAGEDLTLVTKVHATTGNVVVQSAAGNIDLSDRSLLLSAADGSISVDAPRGTVVVQRSAAAEDVTIVGLGGITVLGSVVSEDAGITLKALDGAVDARQVNAADDVTITSFKSGKLAGEIASSAGAVSFTSLAGGLFLEANIVAAGAVDIDAQTFILQDGRSGVERIDVIDGGSATGEAPPAVTVTVAAPVAGGTAARAQAVIGQRSATEYFIESIYIIDPGTGYALGEVAEVTITGMSGAQARAFGPTNLRNVTGGTGVTLEAGDDITLVNTVTATTGDVVVTSETGNLQLNARGFVARAAEGSVSLTGSAGSVVVQRASASEDVTLFAAKDVVVLGSVDAGNDASVVTGADGRVRVTRIVAGDSVTVTAGDGVELLDLVDAATGGVLVTSTAGGLVTSRIYAELDITLKTADQVYLLDVLESAAGDIAIESVAGSVELDSANLLASSGSITVAAHGVVNQPTSTGVVEVRRQSTGQLAAATPPEVRVTIAAPASGTGTAATAIAEVALIGYLPTDGVIFIDPDGNVLAVPPGATPVWGVVNVTVINPGSGYAPNERPLVTFTEIPNAVYEAFAAGSFPTNIVAAEDVRITGGGNVLLSSVVQSNVGDIVIASVSGNLDLSANTFFAHALDGSVVLDSDCGTVVVERVCAEDEVVISAEKGVTIENDIDAGGDITVTAASGLVDSAQSGKQITSRDGAITVSARTAFLGPMRAEQAINVDAQGAIVVGAVTSQAGGFSVLSRADSISLSGAIVAESVTGSAQREFAVLAPVTARTGDVTIVANDGTVALQADVIAVKGDIDLTGRAILQGGLGVAKVVIDPVDPTGKILGQKAGEGYSAATTKVVISAPRRGGTAAQAVPIVGQVRVGTTEESETVNGKTVTRQVPVFADSGIVQLILTSPGTGYEIGEPVTVTFIDPNVESEASATVTLQSVVPNAALVADSGEVRLKATTEALTVQTIKAGSSVALNANKAVTVTDSVVSGGAISLTTPTGGVTARDLLAATGITIAGFADASLSQQIHAKSGDIDIRSTAGSVKLSANVLASEGDVLLNAHQEIAQAQNGLEKIVLTFGGDLYTSPIVTVSPPRGGGTAATARAIVSTEAPGPVLAIELLTPGSGYAPGEFVTVTIEQGANQSAAAIGIASASDPKIVAGGRVAIAAGGDIELENEVRAVTGAVSILSVGGDVELSAPNVIVHAEADAVSVSAATGLVNLGRVIAEEGIDVSSLHALTAAGTLVSEAGDISLVSKAAGVSLSSVVTADAGSIDISAFAAIESKRNGVSRIEILAAGTGYDPDATSVIFAPPGGTLVGGVATGARFGSRAAAGRVNVDQQGRVVGVQVLDPGIGYLPGEAVQVEVRGSGSGASVTAYVDRPVVALSAGSNVTLTAGDDVEVIATVRSTKAGNVSVSSLSGDVTLDADGSLLQAVQGDVAITATAGRVTMPQVTAGGAFAASAKTGLVLNRTVDAGTGDISMRTLHGELRLAQSASVVAKTGDISLASEAGTVQTFAVLNAGDAISVASLGTLTLAGSVVSKAGAIELKSVASDVAFSGIVSAETNTATISAFGNVESATGGVTRIEMVNRGTGYVDVFTQVVVLRGGETVDDDGVIEPDPAELNPRDGFRRAAARAVLNEDGQVVAIEIVDPGRRYLQTDDVRIVIRDTRSVDATGQGATAVAYVDPSDQTLSGLLDVDVKAGRDITLVGVVRSLQGDVTVTSTSGNIGSQDQALPLLHAIQGAVSVTAKAGEAWVVQITAGEDVDVAAKRGVVVSEAIDSTAGDIAIATTHGDLGLENASLVAKAGSVSLTSVAGEIASPLVLKAADAISVSSLGRLTLSGAIASTGGSISLESTAANVTFNAVVSAEQGQVSIAAFGEIESFEGGVSRTTLISGGQNYQKGFTQVIVIKNGETVDAEGNVVPDPAETNAREGFRAATVVAIVAEDGTITGLRISDPGTGYLQSDNVRIVIRDSREDGATGSGASGLAFVDPAVQTVAALGNASLRAGGDIQVIGVVRSLEGDVIVESTSGDLELGGDNVVLQAIEGSVSLTANAGSAKVQQISARNDVIVEAKTGVTLAGKIDSTLGDISLTTTHGHLELDLPGASVVAPGGGVALLSKAGRIEGPDAISASGPIAITSFDTLVANGRIASSAGAVELRSTAGDIDLNAVVEAKNDAILIQAFANINSRDGGVSRIQIVTEGRGYADSNTLVYVLFEDEVDLVDEDTFALTSGDTANSRGEAFRRAAARAILDEQGAVVAVELVDRGSGYLPTDRLITRVFDTRPDDERAGGGATLVTYVDPSAQAVSAGSDVTLKAGDDLTLIGIVRSTAGDVRVETATGNVNLAANQALLQTLAGDVSVSALAGAASIRQINAQGDVDVFASRGVEILRAVESKAGDISLRTDLGDIDLDTVITEVTESKTSTGVRLWATVGAIEITATTGKINTPQTLRAGGDITIKSLGTVELADSILSDAGDITVDSAAARVTLNAVVKAAEGSVTIRSSSDLDDIGGGLTRIDIVNGGSSYSNATTVRVSAPRNGGDAARVRPIIENGRITRLEIVYAGKGYEPGETVVLIGDDTFVDFPESDGDVRGLGAEAIAFCESPTQSIEAKESITVETRDNLKMFGVLRAEGVGGITLRSRAGDVDLIGANRTSTVANATNGGVAVFAPAGAARVFDLLADTSVVVQAEQDITAAGLIRAAEGSISVVSTSGDVVVQGEGKLHAVAGSVEVFATRGDAKVQNLFAGQDITLKTLGDVKLTEAVHAATGDLTVVTKAGIDNAGAVETGGSISLTATLGVTSLGGGIVRIDLLSGGADYEYAIVTISGPASGGGRAATARATINDAGTITAIAIVDPGYGYASGEVVNVRIDGQPVRPVPDGAPLPAGDGARAVATASSISSSLTAGDSIAIAAGTVVDVTNELRAKTGGVTIDVAAGLLMVSEVYAAQDVALTAAQTISLGGLLRTSAGDVAIESTGGSLDMRGIIRAPAGKVQIETAGEVVQRGGSISRNKIFLLSGGSGYTSALVVVDPPPGAGQAALARAVITDPNPFDDDDTGYISEIILLDPGWGYPSDSRVNVRIIGEGGDGAAAVFGTEVISSTIEANGDVAITSGDDITLISTVRSTAGDVGILATLGDVSIESVTAGQAVDVTSKRGAVTLVSVSATQAATIIADQGVLVSDSLNTLTGDITIETTDGDITFAKKLALVGGYVEGPVEEIEPQAVISSKAGGIAITAHNGAIVTPFVINAGGDVSLVSLQQMELENQITSQGGDIYVESTSSLVRVRTNMVAEAGSITVEAQTRLQQEFVSGISKIELLSSGEIRDEVPVVSVSVAAPRNGGEAATAYAVIERRPIDNNEDDDGNPFDNVVEYEYFIGSIAIINPGYGYDVGENPIVTITGVDGATARAYGPTMVGMITAQEDVSLLAGENITLISKIHAVNGTVAVASKAGDIDLTANSLFLSSKAGGIDIDAYAGSVNLQNATAFTNVSIGGARGVAIEGVVDSATGSVTVDATAGEVMIQTILAGNGVTVGASHDVTLLGTIAADGGDISIVSRNRDLDFTAAGVQLNALQGGVSLAAVNGTIMSPPTLHASKNVTLTSFNTLALSNEITSDTGVIDLKSTSGSINLGANLDARDDSIRIHAKGSVTQIGGGIGFVRVLNGGSGYTAAATVAIAAPSGGGIAARGVPIIGRVNGVNGVITGIRITNPGSGYGAGEQPAVTFTRNAVPPQGVTWLDASVMAVASPALGNSGLAAIDVVDGGSGYTAATTVTIAAPVGGGTAATAQAVIGAVEVNGVMTNGVILDIVIVNPGSGYGAGEQPVVTIDGAGTGAVARAIANIALQDIRGGQDIDIYAGTGVTLLNTIRADQGHVSITSETGNVNLTARTLLVSSFMDDIEITSRRGAIAVQRLAADGDITVKAQTGVTLLNAVNSTGDFDTGNVSIYTVNGNIAAVAPNGLISVQNGGVSLESVNGTILVPQVFNVTGDVSLKTFGNLTIDRPLTSSAGSVTLASATGAVNIAANVFADERVTLSAKTGISQTKGSFIRGNELVASNSTTSAVNLTNPANDFANVSLMSLGAVSYVDANDFETGVERSPYSGTPLGVEVRGESLNLSSVGTNSRIRVVSGLSYKTLSIAAGTQGGNNVGYVEYVTTSTGDNPQANAAFRGTLRDMIRYTNDNTATYVNAGNTRVPQPQMMVFDETGYLVEEVTPAAALPAFSRPVWFDGGRLEETATANRLGISGNNSLLHGLSFAPATPAVTGVRPATPGSSGSRVENLAVYGFTKGSGVVLASGNNTVVDLHAGLKADGTVSGNMIGLDVRGAAAINNTIGEQVVDAETVNRFAANTMAGIMIRNGAAGTQVFGSVIGDDSGANPALANGDGIQIVNATRSQIGSANAVEDDLYPSRSNIIAGNLSAGVRISNAVAGTLAAANVIRNNVIRGNRTGVDISASAFAVLGGPDAGAANVITGQTLSGVVVTDSRSVQIQGNRIGVVPAFGDQLEAVAGNGADGIAISGKSQAVEISGGNWIGGNTAHGVRIGSGVTGVMMRGNTIGGTLADGSAAGNGQDGVAITAAIGNTIGAGNVIARNGRHGVSITDARAETLLAGNRVFGSTISGNRSNGVLIGGGSLTTIGGPTVADANLITGNEGDGIRLVSTSVTNAATGHVIQRNYVGSNPAGDVNSELGNKGSGISLVGTRDVVVGEGNVVMNNGVDGIAVNGGRGVTIGSANAAGGNQIRRNAGHGVSFNGAVVGGRVMGNQIGFQGGDGVFVGGGAQDVRIGHIVTQSAVSGAANVVRGNAGWGVRVMPGAQRIAVQGNSSFGNMQGAMSRAAGANAAAPSSVTLTSAVMRTATGGTRQLVVTGTIAGARARQQYSVDVYASSVGESAQGRRHLGRFNVTATADGLLRFNSTITATVAVDEWISVAATTLVFDPGATSQFSAPVKAALR